MPTADLLRVATCWGIPSSSSSSEPPNIETTDPTRRLVPIIPPSLLVLTSPVLQQSVHPTELFTQVLAENSQLLASVTITNSVAREPSESWFPAKLFDEYDRNGLKHLKPWWPIVNIQKLQNGLCEDVNNNTFLGFAFDLATKICRCPCPQAAPVRVESCANDQGKDAKTCQGRHRVEMASPHCQMTWPSPISELLEVDFTFANEHLVNGLPMLNSERPFWWNNLLV